MKTIRKNKVLLFAFVALLVLSLGLATIFAGTFKNTMAETANVGSAVFVEGAEIRAKADVNDTGIRFTAKIDSDLADALFTTNEETGYANGFKDDCSLGMIIVPKQALDAVKEGEDYFTVLKEKFGRAKESIAVDFSFEQNNIGANKVDEVLDADYPYLVKGAIVGLYNANLQYEYAAVVYYSTDGGESFVYSQRSSEVNFAEKANEVLETLDVDDSVKASIVSYVAKTVLMKEVGNVEGYELKGNVATVTADLLKKSEEDGNKLNDFFAFDVTEPTASDLVKATLVEDTLKVEGFGKATVTASAYKGALQYVYNIDFYPEAETDLEKGDFGKGYKDAESITFGDRTFYLTDGVATFALLGEEDARNLPSDKEQDVSVVVGGETYQAKVTLWSLLVDSTNINTMQDYEYKINNEGTFGFFKLKEDVAVAHFAKETQLGRDCIKLGGDELTKDNGEALTRGFKGVFEGNGKTLSYSAPTDVETKPLFFNLAAGSIVRNLNVVKEAGKYGQPLIAKYGAGFVIDNVSIDIKAEGGSFGEREGMVVAVLYGPKDVTFKDLSFEFYAPSIWSYGSSPLIAKGTESEAHGVTSRFSGKVILDNVNINFASDRFFYDHESYPSNMYNKLFNGLVYSNVEKVGDGEYTADWAPIITAVEGLDTLTMTIAGKAKKYSVKEATLFVEKGETINLINAVPGATLRKAYDIFVDETFVVIGEAMVSGNKTSYSRRADDVFEAEEKGTFNYLVVTTDYEMVYTTVTVVEPSVVTIETEVVADLKDGIDVAKLLAVAKLPNDETVATAKFGGASYSVSDGVVSFGDVSDMTDAIKMLAKEDAYELTLIGAENKYIFTNFKLYSILVSNAAEYHEVVAYQTSAGYTANGGKGFWAVIGFDADVALDALVAADILGPASPGLYGGFFTGVIDGRGHTISNFKQIAQSSKGFSSTADGAKLKNMYLKVANQQMYGLFGAYSSGIIIEDVVIESGVQAFGGGGFLFFYMAGTKDFVLKNVTVINTSTLGSVDLSRFWLGNPYGNTAKPFKGKIIVDNVIYVQQNAAQKIKIFTGLNFAYGMEHTIGYGDAIVLAEGATKGITIYDSKADYLAETNGHVVTSKVMADPIIATKSQAFDCSTLVDEGKTFLYASTCLSETATGPTLTPKTGTTITFTAAGTYKLLVVDTDWTNYIYTVVVE